MKYSMSIAMVAILLAAAFVGVVAMDDESDAAVSYTISVDKVDIDISNGEITLGDENTRVKISNEGLGNTLSVDGNKISGIVVKAPMYNANTTLVKHLWGADAEETHMFVFSISGLATGSKVVFIPSNEDRAHPTSLKVISVSNGVATITMRAPASGEIPAFEFIVSDSSAFATDTGLVPTSTITGDASTEASAWTIYKGMTKEKIEFDIECLGSPVEVRYTIGDFTCIQDTFEGKKYTLASLEDLNTIAPSGKKFIGWTDGTNTYTAGTIIEFQSGSSTKFTAVFEALPEAVITFVDGTSTLKSINVSDLSEKTVPSVEKTGYTFDGWFMGDVKVDPLAYTFEESVTLVAQWTPINCYVTFVAGDFVKTVPVLYGDRVQAPALPDGFEKWNFDFSVVITDDLTITAVEKAPEKPTGLADPTIKMALVVVGLFVCVLLAVIILKREDIRAGMVRKLSKAEDVKEDKKE